ncbi:MAG: cytochrome b561 [Candidatus Azotimanducaceae bacterium]
MKTFGLHVLGDPARVRQISGQYRVTPALPCKPSSEVVGRVIEADEIDAAVKRAAASGRDGNALLLQINLQQHNRHPTMDTLFPSKPKTKGIKYSIGVLLTALSTSAVAAVQSASTPKGVPSHIESWIALGLVIFAFLVAWLLNHRTPKLRALGTLLVSLGCFSIVAWFTLVLGSGIIENPKPHQTPMDAAKPALLWLHISIAFVGGIILMVVANKQRSRAETLDLPRHNELSRYGLVSRVLHWATAILFVILIPMGIFASMIPEDIWYRTEYNVAHKTIGFIVLGLFVVRLIWNRLSKRPTLDPSLTRTEHKLAHGAHVALYILMFALPITGYVMTSLHGYPSYFFAWEIDPFLAESDAYIYWGLFHKYILQYLVYLILGAHVLGALKHHYLDKHEAALKRMVN